MEHLNFDYPVFFLFPFKWKITSVSSINGLVPSCGHFYMSATFFIPQCSSGTINHIYGAQNWVTFAQEVHYNFLFLINFFKHPRILCMKDWVGLMGVKLSPQKKIIIIMK